MARALPTPVVLSDPSIMATSPVPSAAPGLPTLPGVPTPVSPGGFDAWRFDNRRWYHPAALLVALALGGATPAGATLGLVFVAIFMSLRCWAARHIGGAARVHQRKALRPRRLVTEGPFAYVRNPLYVANAFGVAGSSMLVTSPGFGLLIGAGCIAWYLGVIRFEHAALTRLYDEEYRLYVVRTPAFVPRLSRRWELPQFPDPSECPEPAAELYAWRKVFRRERGALGFTALLLALGVWRVVGLLSST